MIATNPAIIHVIRRIDRRHRPWKTSISSLFVVAETIGVRYTVHHHDGNRHWFGSYSIANRKIDLIQSNQINEEGEIITSKLNG